MDEGVKNCPGDYNGSKVVYETISPSWSYYKVVLAIRERGMSLIL
jgi:hypothetical protein